MSTPAPQLRFALEHFEVGDVGSIGTLLAARGKQSGLFVLRFVDGAAFVGHSDNIAAQYLRAVEQWPDIDSIEVAPGTAEEVPALREMVGSAVVLRDGGDEAPASVEPVGAKAALPKERAKRTTLTDGAAGTHRARFWELSDHIAYPAIRSVVADYVNASITDPANTARYLWQVQALPGDDAEAGPRRLLVLTCAGFETLRIDEITHEDDTIELDLRINTSVPRDRTDAELEISNDTVSAGRGPYREERVWSWSIDLGALLEEDVDVDLGIDDDTFDDLAYALNARLMRSGDTRAAASHNRDLAADLLAEAYRQLFETE